MIKRSIKIFFYGMAMGTADIIPGVSGATIAYILGFYEQFLQAIKSIDWDIFRYLKRGELKRALLRPHWAFIIPLILGIGTAVIILTKIIGFQHLVRLYPQYVYGFFFGLILASIPLFFRRFRFSMQAGLWLVFGVLVATVGLQMISGYESDHMGYVFLSGFLALMAMMLPGISGSYILLILGQYVLILDAIAEFNIAILFPFALGALLSLVSVSRLLHGLIKQFPSRANFLIMGLLLGSLWKVWPFQERIYQSFNGKEKLVETTILFPSLLSMDTWFCLALMIIGAGIILILSYFNQNHQP